MLVSTHRENNLSFLVILQNKKNGEFLTNLHYKRIHKIFSKIGLNFQSHFGKEGFDKNLVVFGRKKNCSKNSGVLDKRSENQLVLLLAMKENTDGRVKKIAEKVHSLINWREL